jgi:hypothetical protein
MREIRPSAPEVNVASPENSHSVVSPSSKTWLPRAPSALQAAVIAGLEGDGAALRAQVAVPGHLREGDRHQEPPALDPQPRHRVQFQEREIEAGVPRVVVVADERQRRDVGRQQRVLVAAVVEVAADAEDHLAAPELEPGTQLDPPPVVVLRRRRVFRPLLAREAVAVELCAEIVAGLIDRLRLLGESGSAAGERNEHGEPGQRTFHDTSAFPVLETNPNRISTFGRDSNTRPRRGRARPRSSRLVSRRRSHLDRRQAAGTRATAAEGA